MQTHESFSHEVTTHYPPAAEANRLSLAGRLIGLPAAALALATVMAGCTSEESRSSSPEQAKSTPPAPYTLDTLPNAPDGSTVTIPKGTKVVFEVYEHIEGGESWEVQVEACKPKSKPDTSKKTTGKNCAHVDVNPFDLALASTLANVTALKEGATIILKNRGVEGTVDRD